VQTQECLMLLLLINRTETDAVLVMTVRTHTKILSNESVCVYIDLHYIITTTNTIAAAIINTNRCKHYAIYLPITLQFRSE
jgi:hypothetical protein